MEPGFHALSELFAQLGLKDDAAAIEDFIERHRPLPSRVALADAPFWGAAEASFLREAIAQDSDWAEVVEQLDARLR